jgi:hypothetical protein
MRDQGISRLGITHQDAALPVTSVGKNTWKVCFLLDSDQNCNVSTDFNKTKQRDMVIRSFDGT